MPEEDLSPISKLLRMKRHEQPPPEYFENFLREFQQRQRAEMLRRPAWRIALERMQARFSDLTREITSRIAPAQFAYGGASAAVLVIAVMFTANMLQHPGGSLPAIAMDLSQPQVLTAQAHQANQAPVAVEIPVRMAAHVPARFTLDSEVRFPDLFPNEAPRVTQPGQQPGQARQHPRYILDTRPASYEPPFSF